MINIINTNYQFQEAISTLFLIHFLNNPLDISFQIYKFIKIIENEALSFSKHFSNEFLLCFDDIFSLSLPTFSIYPLIHSNFLEIFLNLFSNLKLSPILDYSLITLKSIISHINELEKKK